METDEDKIDVDLINKSIKESNLDKFIYNLPNKIETKLEKMDLDYLVVKNRGWLLLEIFI